MYNQTLIKTVDWFHTVRGQSGYDEYKPFDQSGPLIQWNGATIDPMNYHFIDEYVAVKKCSIKKALWLIETKIVIYSYFLLIFFFFIFKNVFLVFV